MSVSELKQTDPEALILLPPVKVDVTSGTQMHLVHALKQIIEQDFIEEKKNSLMLRECSSLNQCLMNYVER